jgi:hypothetical protein
MNHEEDSAGPLFLRDLAGAIVIVALVFLVASCAAAVLT